MKQNKLFFQSIAFIGIISVIIIGIFYFGAYEDKYSVKESQVVLNKLLEQPLTYNNEFCAKKLTNILTELHFLEQELNKEQELLAKDEAVQAEEPSIIKLEDKEIEEIKAEFDQYRLWCDLFEQNASSELCTLFLDDSANNTRSIQQQIDLTESFWERLNLKMKELSDAKRMDQELKQRCEKK
ncbi:MAG: hypothetical protein ABIA37_00415 [Candidatus Woesearchaeota archaeon]